MLKLKNSIIFLIIFPITITAQAEIYKWVDENGKVHFSDKRNSKSDATKPVEKVEVESVNETSAPPSFDNIYREMHKQELAKQRIQRQRVMQQQQLKAEQNKKARCERDVKRFQSFGIRGNTNQYMVDKNGKSLTDKEQTAKLEQVKKDLIQRGCLPPGTK